MGDFGKAIRLAATKDTADRHFAFVYHGDRLAKRVAIEAANEYRGW